MMLLKTAARRITGLGLASVLLSGLHVADASGEPRRVSGTGTHVAQLASTKIFLRGDPSNETWFDSNLWAYQSRDPAWDAAQVFSVALHDPEMRQKDELRGHMAIAHPHGDLTFLVFEGSRTALSPSEWAWELTGHFVRGTGRFAGITGRWWERSEWRMGGVTSEWRVEYEVK